MHATQAVAALTELAIPHFTTRTIFSVANLGSEAKFYANVKILTVSLHLITSNCQSVCMYMMLGKSTYLSSVSSLLPARVAFLVCQLICAGTVCQLWAICRAERLSHQLAQHSAHTESEASMSDDACLASCSPHSAHLQRWHASPEYQAILITLAGRPQCSQGQISRCGQQGEVIATPVQVRALQDANSAARGVFRHSRSRSADQPHRRRLPGSRALHVHEPQCGPPEWHAVHRYCSAKLHKSAA